MQLSNTILPKQIVSIASVPGQWTNSICTSSSISTCSGSTLLFQIQGFRNTRAVQVFASLVVLIKSTNYTCMMRIKQTIVSAACTYNYEVHS